jgi:hypothetical protein
MSASGRPLKLKCVADRCRLFFREPFQGEIVKALIGFQGGRQMQENGWHGLVPTRVMQAAAGKYFTPEQRLLAQSKTLH